MRARKYTQVDSLYSHTFGWFYDVRGMDDLFLYSSRGRHRNNQKYVCCIREYNESTCVYLRARMCMEDFSSVFD